MSKKKLGMSSFDIDKKFDCEEEAFKYAKRLKEYIRYICKQKSNDGWQAQAMICISNVRGSTAYTYYEHNGKVGRPKVKKDFSSFDIKYYGKCGLNTEYHLHVLLVSKPTYAFRNMIKDYIDKNWCEKKEKIYKEIIGDKKVYKKNTNINKAEYFIDQSYHILFCNYNYTDDLLIPSGYSLKDLYKAYMKLRTANKYCGKYIKSNNWNEKIKLEERYDNIKRFYFELTKEQDKKANEEYMRRIRLNKIKENYDLFSLKMNKVQNNEYLL